MAQAMGQVLWFTRQRPRLDQAWSAGAFVFAGEMARLDPFPPLCHLLRQLLTVVVALVALALPVLGEAAPRRLAVLDFVNSAKDPAVEWVGPAVAETITTKLHAVPLLHVVERFQLYRLLQEQKPPFSEHVDPSRAARIGKLLGAEQVVLGAYSMSGQTARFTVRLVDVATGAIVATSQADGLLDPHNPNLLWTALVRLTQTVIDSLDTRVAIVRRVRRPVRVPLAQRIKLTPEERARLARAPTATLAALEAYGQGQVAYKRRQRAEAARLFELATALDPDYSVAWHSLGIVLDNLRRDSDALRAYERAHQLYARLGDEPGIAQTLTSIGTVHRRQGNYAEALDYYTRSLLLLQKLRDGPGIALTLTNIGIVRSNQGLYREALLYVERGAVIAKRLGMAEAQQIAEIQDFVRAQVP